MFLIDNFTACPCWCQQPVRPELACPQVMSLLLAQAGLLLLTTTITSTSMAAITSTACPVLDLLPTSWSGKGHDGISSWMECAIICKVSTFAQTILNPSYFQTQHHYHYTAHTHPTDHGTSQGLERQFMAILAKVIQNAYSNSIDNHNMIFQKIYFLGGSY